jgi:uncharacterized protein (DUF1778 family)
MIKPLPPETLAWLRQTAKFGGVTAQALLHLLERLEALERRPIPGTVEMAADCSALDARAWAYIGKQAMCGDPAATALIDLLNNPPAPQPTPPAAPAGGLVGRVEARAGGDGRAAIREMAAALLEWHHSDELVHTAWEAAKWLEQETDQ